MLPQFLGKNRENNDLGESQHQCLGKQVPKMRIQVSVTRFLFLAGFALGILGCEDGTLTEPEIATQAGTQFSKIPAATSNVTFSNTLKESREMNYFVHSGFYNGAGIAVGDVNNDGLEDLFFAGNQSDNALYLNSGDFQFRDITASAAVAATGSWCSGATMVDINADGWLDVYVCRYFSQDKQQAPSKFAFHQPGQRNLCRSGCKIWP